jgi:hypothetical protein
MPLSVLVAAFMDNFLFFYDNGSRETSWKRYEVYIDLVSVVYYDLVDLSSRLER